MKTIKTWRMMAAIALAATTGGTLAGPVVTGGGPGGTDRTGLTLWLKADTLSLANGAAVSSWADSSGKNNNASQATASHQPSYTNGVAHLNGMPAVAFTRGDSVVYSDNNANDDYLTTANSVAVNQETVFAVWDTVNYKSAFKTALGRRWTDKNALHSMAGAIAWDYGDYTDGSAAIAGGNLTGADYTSDNTNTALICSALRDQGANLASVYVDGVLKRSTNFTSAGGAGNYYTVGTRYSSSTPNNCQGSFDGLIPEIITFDRALTNSAERILVENYLSSKYNRPLSANDKYAGDTAASGDYDLDVFGIGRVDAANQITNAGSAGFGILVASTLADNQWILAGHRQANNARVTTGVPAGCTYRWARVWCVTNAAGLGAEVAFDFSDSGLPEPQAGVTYKLLYSASTNLGFTAQAATPTVNGDTVSFTLAAGELPSGYYTLASDEVMPVVTPPAGNLGPGGTDRTSLTLWLKADTLSLANGAAVASWSDSSGKSNNATQGTASRQPAYTNSVAHLNNMPAVSFVRGESADYSANHTNDDFLYTANSLTHDRETVFAVWDTVNYKSAQKGILGRQWTDKNTLVSAGGGITWDYGDYSDGSAAIAVTGVDYTSDNANTALIGSVLRDKGANLAAVYVDGVLKKTTTFTGTAGQDGDRYLVGTRHAQGGWQCSFDGLIPEIIAFSRAVTNAAERILIENYLSSKYSRPLSANDKYAGDTMANGDYDRDVFGIGRVDAASAIVTNGQSGFGLAAPWGLVSGQWALAGHKTPTNQVVVAGGGGVAMRWDRVWYVDQTGYFDLTFAFDFTASGLSKATGGYKLLYSPDTNFVWTVLSSAASEVGTTILFTVPAAQMADGFYTLGWSPQGTFVTIQ